MLTLPQCLFPHSTVHVGVAIKARVHLKTVFIPFIFLAIKNPSAYPNIYVLGFFVTFLVIFCVYLGIDNFSQRVSEIYVNRKCWRFDVFLKLEFDIKNCLTCTKQFITNLAGVAFWVVQLSGGFSKLFWPFNPFLNFLKFPLNSCLPLWWTSIPLMGE